jgi:TonB family protein
VRNRSAGTVSIAALVLGAHLYAQDPQIIRVGALGVTQPRLVKDSAPMYPTIAANARIQGVVILEATIAPDGRVSSARVTRSIPLLDPAALDAVKRWEFVPTILNGSPVSVVTTVTVSFRPANGAAISIIPDVPSKSGMPLDFGVVYIHNCPQTPSSVCVGVARDVLSAHSRGRVFLELSRDELEAVYRTLLVAGLLSPRIGPITWRDSPAVGTTVVHEDGVEVTLAAEFPFFDVTDGPTPPQYFLDVRSNGMWARLWPLGKGETRTREYEKQLGPVRDLMRRLIERRDVLRGLRPRERRSCTDGLKASRVE